MRNAHEEYNDTAETLRFRAEVEAINLFLAEADLSLDHCLTFRPYDTSDRYVRRIFTQSSFESGGRLFGGFWQTMKKVERFSALRIQGERTAEVDYGQMMPRLVYALCGEVPTAGDLYSIGGFEKYRAGVKTVMSAMLFCDRELSRFPKGCRKLFPDDVTIDEVTTAIRKAHPAIAPAFGASIGHKCQFWESQILIAVLVELRTCGVVALPIHDAVLVPASQAQLASDVMLRIFFDMTHIQGSIEVKLVA